MNADDIILEQHDLRPRIAVNGSTYHLLLLLRRANGVYSLEANTGRVGLDSRPLYSSGRFVELGSFAHDRKEAKWNFVNEIRRLTDANYWTAVPAQTLPFSYAETRAAPALHFGFNVAGGRFEEKVKSTAIAELDRYLHLPHAADIRQNLLNLDPEGIGEICATSPDLPFLAKIALTGYARLIKMRGRTQKGVALPHKTIRKRIASSTGAMRVLCTDLHLTDQQDVNYAVEIGGQGVALVL